MRIFEAAPDRLGLDKIVKDIDAGDAARFRPRWCLRRSAFDRGSHGHLRNLSVGKYLHFSARPTFAKKGQQRVMTMRHGWADTSALRGRDVAI
jgi:hypothetical protein